LIFIEMDKSLTKASDPYKKYEYEKS